MALMHAAGGVVGEKEFRSALREEKGRWIMHVSPMIQDIATALQQGRPVTEISQRFHRTLISCFLEIIGKAANAAGIKTVVLSGGVFQNELLFVTLLHELQQAGYRVLTHARIPPNDGGLSLGQAIIGRRMLS